MDASGIANLCNGMCNPDNQPAFRFELNSTDTSGVASSSASPQPSHSETVDTTRIVNAVNEILGDMDQGACAETIAQTVQIITLANGKKAAVRVLVTTDADLFM